MNRLLRAARLYCSAGISVIPFVPRDKNPDMAALAASGNFVFPQRASWSPFTRRLPTEEELHTWFEDGSRNLGVVTGYGNLLALDFDDKDLFEEWRSAHRDIAGQTCIQETSQGFHVLFRWRQTWTTAFYPRDWFEVRQHPGKIAGELRGMHAHVAAWPSVHPSGFRYRWLPGQAPWEVGILSIDGLDQVSVRVLRGPISTVLGALPRFFSHPRQSLSYYGRWLRFRYRILRGFRARERKSG